MFVRLCWVALSGGGGRDWGNRPNHAIQLLNNRQIKPDCNQLSTASYQKTNMFVMVTSLVDIQQLETIHMQGRIAGCPFWIELAVVKTRHNLSQKLCFGKSGHIYSEV